MSGSEFDSNDSTLTTQVGSPDSQSKGSPSPQNLAFQDPNDVSYAILETRGIDENLVLQDVATAINVRLSLEGNQELPYVEFDNFAVALRQDKTFLYGPGGSGKSRGIFEIIKRNIRDITRIIFVNPRNNVGIESGRIRLSDLVAKFSDNDVVVWDNFPDDLIKRDIANAREVLERISSPSVRKLLVALKPKYLEVLREIPSEIPEFYSHRITYDKEKIKSIIRLYGTSLKKHTETYERVIAGDLDRIAKQLWQREPIPLTILDYYNELTLKLQGVKSPSSGKARPEGIDGYVEAERLLRSTNYYEHQFALLTGFQERRSDVEFLHTLKLAYELGIPRDAVRLEKLQNEIFGSNPPMAPNEKLSTWVYLSGNYYSMHDVCREAIRFTDFVRLRILNYLTDDPARIVGVHKDSRTVEHNLALFLGRHVQNIPRESPSQFVPDGLSGYMKKFPSFNRMFGQGVGEVFDSIEEDLQNTILLRVDVDVPFASGLAESLGHMFPWLDSEKRRRVLQKIYSGLLFARYFGQSLGRLLPQLPNDTKREVLAHMEWNPQFADGIGMGYGYIYASLDGEAKKQAFSMAENNMDMARGLGFGFGLVFQSLDLGVRSEVMSQADVNSEFDKGLGMGLGEIYHEQLPENLKADVLERRSVRSEFALGLGISIARANSEKTYDDLMDLLESDAELAHGLGMGYGASVVYLSKDSLSHLMSLADENERFDLGLGSGVGFLFKHLPPQLQSWFLERGNINNEFDQGLGFGLGFTWMYQTADMRKRVFDRSGSHSNFAYGLGYGVGYHFRYFEDSLKQDLLKRASQDSEFARGLGYGLGYSYPYLDAEAKRQFLDRIEFDQQFALGLGTGLGRVLRYLTATEKESLLAKAAGNTQFGIGIGYGLGRYVIMYTDREFQRDLFTQMKNNSQLAYGLGYGLAYSYTHISVEFQNRIMGQMALENNAFARGLGAGFGTNLRYLPLNLRDRLFSYAEQNIQFAEGFGESIGTVFRYLKDVLRERISAAATTESAFARGLGKGLGIVYSYFPDDLRKQVFRLAESNNQMTSGLGVGLGSIFNYLNELLQEEIISYASRGFEFLKGFGEGLGSILGYCPSVLGDKKISTLLDRREFLQGIGRGLGSSYTNHESRLQPKLSAAFSGIPLDGSFYSGLGLGMGSNLAGLSSPIQTEILKLSERNQSFAISLGFGIAHVYPYLPPSIQNDVLYGHVNINSDFAYGFGLGVGHGFVFLPSQIQERVLAISKDHGDLAKGLGHSLGRIFRYLDSVLQQELLRCQESNSVFAEAFGKGLAMGFPLLPNSLQQILVQKLETAGAENSLVSGLAIGLGESMKYLEKDVQDRLAAIADLNPRIKQLLFELAKNASHENDFFEDFPVVPITFVTSGHFEASSWNLAVGAEEILFSGQRSTSCVCIVDMVNSTGVTAGLNDVQLGRYYSIFLNAMAIIARNFGAKIIKNAGDSLLFYFPRTVDSTNPVNFRDVLECGMTMIAAHAAINAKLLDEKMPAVNYRISADYGKVEIAKSVSSQSDDLFGPAMNMTAKINARAKPNGMAIGDDLYKIVKVLEEYVFDQAQEYLREDQKSYSLYHVRSKDPGRIINPFKRTSASR